MKQIFISNYWGDGPSVWGGGDGMSFMIGYLHWALPLLVLLSFLFFYFFRKKIIKPLVLPSLLCAMGYICLFFIHGRSAPLWNLIKPLQIIQFPWRFLNPATFLLTTSLSMIPLYLSKKSQKMSFVVSLTLLALVYIINVTHFYPVVHGPLTDQQKFSGVAWRNLVTAGIYDYLPKTARLAALKPAVEYVDDSQPPILQNQISQQKHGTDWLLFNVNLTQDSQITISQLAFPEFKIFDNNHQINYTVEQEFGRMVVKLSPGFHQIFIKLYNTPIRSLANALSIISWLFVITYLSRNLWTKSVLKK